MPLIASFYGITIRMYFQQSEHNPPHVHAYYGEYVLAISIVGGVVLDGWLPQRALTLVRDWIGDNEAELLDMWRTQEFKRLPPLE